MLRLKETCAYWFWVAVAFFVLDGEALFNYLRSFRLFPLACNGVLCGWHLRFVHPTCLYCRARRVHFTKYKKPSYWVSYTYHSFQRKFYTNRYVYGRVCDNGVWKGGTEYTSAKPFQVYEYETLKIDPRGRFLALRCASIIVIDKLMYKFKIKQNWGLAEICEFLANYPT